VSGAVDSIHDLGGMHGFGPVVAEAGEPVFHDAWEGRVFGLMIVTGSRGLRDGLLRPHIEQLAPSAYLASSYYDRWLRAVEAGLLATGTLTETEIEERMAQPAPTGRTADPATARELVAALTRPNADPPARPPARFAVGDRVTVRRMAPAGHTRCPRYVRGATGTVTAVLGGWPVPDLHYEGGTETVYTVAFPLTALWGGDAEAGELRIDLWERYLA
jgi:nitrile hydratase